MNCSLPRLLKCPCLLLFLWMIPAPIFSQNFTPVTVTGFNHDVIAETGTSALTTTTIALDGPAASNKVIYSVAFRIANGAGGGGIPDNGTITDAAGSYQLASYSGNNALLLQRTQTGNLTLATPAGFSAIRVLAFATEGVALVNVVLTFTDGSTTNALTNYSLSDWFNVNTNLVTSGFGRVTRTTPASNFGDYPSNPRMYYINIPLSCTDRMKQLQRVSFTNVTTAGNNAPFPNAVFLGISGRAFTQSITPTITNATCTATGSATLAITGSASPYTITWNTVPPQTGPTATGLTPGNYTATIVDAGACSSTYLVTITQQNNLNVTMNEGATICPGGSASPNTVSNATTYSWTPTTGVSNPNIANPVFSPTQTTTYTLTATLGTCTITRSFLVTVAPAIILSARTDTTICPGSTFSPNINNTGQTAGTTYSWTPSYGVSNPAILNPVLSPGLTTTYTLTATNGPCSASRTFKVTVAPVASISAGLDGIISIGRPSVQLLGSGSAGTYLWTPATGLSATNILNPVASPTQNTTYTLKVTTPEGCTATDDVLVTVISSCLKPMEAFTPNGDGFNDLWYVTSGNCAKLIRALVYNRYGSKVFESQDYHNNWDGKYKNKPVADGTYYYVITYYLQDGSLYTAKGNVTILR